MAIRTVRVVGLNELSQKTGWDFLAQPEIDDALGTAAARAERQGKGIAAGRNTITSEIKPLSVASMTTLNYPRTTGEARHRYLTRALPPVMRNAMKKAVARIEARWAG